MRQRISKALRTVAGLAYAGVTWPSVLLYPIRRRGRHARIELRFRDGLTITAERDTPVLEIYREIWTDQCYLAREFHVRPRGTIVDIGAHIGMFSIWAARRFPGSRIIAVEPAPRTLAHLRRNFADNGIANAQIVPCACAAQDNDRTLYCRGLDWAHTIYPRDRVGLEFQPVSRVRATTLKSLFQDFEVHDCELLKIDCEGAEYELLSSAPDHLLRHVRHIALEYHLDAADSNLGAIQRILGANGFLTGMRETSEAGGYLYAWRE